VVSIETKGDPIDREENRQLRRESIHNHYLLVTGRAAFHTMSSIMMAASAPPQQRVAMDEARVQQPNIHVPAGDDPSMYLAQ